MLETCPAIHEPLALFPNTVESARSDLGTVKHTSNCDAVKSPGSVLELKQRPIFSGRKMRTVVIGAGASGIYIAIRQDQLLRNVEFQVYEKNADVGGTWFENKYPGATCDVPSHNYTYTFAGKTDWSQYYAGSDEIQSYFSGVADKYRIRRFIKFNHCVKAAIWDESKSKYQLEILTSDGKIIKDECDVLVNACGLLNGWKWPNIPGLHSFKGSLLHSANFDKEWTPNGRTVALIGNGSTGIQILPNIQPHAEHVDAYIRSPTWISVPFASTKNKQPGRNPKYTEEEKRKFADDPKYHLQFRCELEHEFNFFFDNFINGSDQQQELVKLLTSNMKKALAERPHLSSFLIPKFGVGCRRITPGVGYLEALCMKNVEAITQEIDSVTETGVIAADGKERAVDTIICATGFDVSFTPRFKLMGRNGFKCDKDFGRNPKAYMTVAIACLPNYFIFDGPQACASNGSFLPVLEATGDYIIKCIAKMQKQDILSMCPKLDVVEEQVKHADAFHRNTVWSHSCRSWYKNNTADGRVAAVWPGSTLHFLESLEDPRWEDYEFTYENSRNRFSYMGNGTTVSEVNGEERAKHIRSRVQLFDTWWAMREKELDLQQD